MKPAQKGFTLVELLVVITIIGLLSVIGMTLFSGVQGRARDSQRLDDAKKIITALEQFKSGAGRYPGINCNWCGSTGGANWIPELDTSNFRNNAVPTDPKNTGPNPELWYYYTSDGNDYCLQISQESNASGHPYYKSNGTGGGYNNGSWKLRFGSQGALGGLCNSR